MDLSKMNISSYLPAMPYKVRELFDKATNLVMNYSETEAKVVEATNDESWGPPGKLLQDLSQLSYSSEHYNEVTSIVFQHSNTELGSFLDHEYAVETLSRAGQKLLETNVQSKFRREFGHVIHRPFSAETFVLGVTAAHLSDQKWE